MTAKRSTRCVGPLLDGLVVAAYGKHWLVEASGGSRRLCHARGRRQEAVVGDHVRWAASQDEGVIESVQPRRNLMMRQDAQRSKCFAANIDQVLILLAAEPEFSHRLLTRALIATAAAGVDTLLVLNKADLRTAFALAWERLADVRRLVPDVLPLSLKHGTDEDRLALLDRLEGKATLVLGPSGAGKSTLINALIPGAQAQTGALSEALQSGRHTTTRTTWYWLDREQRTALIDSPGFQEFGLHHLVPEELAPLMPDLRAHLGGCRFANCSHLHEPGCAVRAALCPSPEKSAESGPKADCISAERYEIYSDLWLELDQARRAVPGSRPVNPSGGQTSAA